MFSLYLFVRFKQSLQTALVGGATLSEPSNVRAPFSQGNGGGPLLDQLFQSFDGRGSSQDVKSQFSTTLR